MSHKQELLWSLWVISGFRRSGFGGLEFRVYAFAVLKSMAWGLTSSLRDSLGV